MIKNDMTALKSDIEALSTKLGLSVERVAGPPALGPLSQI